MENYELTLGEYWRIIRKRRNTIVIVFTLVMASTFIFTKMQTPIYQSSLELKIEHHQPTAAVTASEKGAQVDTEPPEDNLETDIRLITSLPVMEKVVEKLEVLPVEQEEREKMINAMGLKYQGFVTVDQIHGTNILTIKALSSDPKKAALMATAIADVYSFENIKGRKKQSEALIKYIDHQLEEYRRQLAIQEGQLQKFNQNEKVFEVKPKVKATLDRMTIQGTFEFESEMVSIDSQLKALQEEDSTREVKSIFEKMTNEDLSDNYIFIGLKRRLLELEFERFLLLIDYTEKHPAVIAQDKVISEVKNKIVRSLRNSLQVPFTPQMDSDLAIAIKKLFLETRKEVLYRIVNKFYGDSGSLSSNQVEYVELKRNVDHLLNSYDTLIQRRDEAKLNLAKVIDDVVTVVSPADIPQHPIKPNAAVNYMVSCVVGLFLGLIVGFVSESLDSSVGTINDVEQELNLAILGIIPHIGGEYISSQAVKGMNEPDKKILMQRLRLVTLTNPKSWPAESYKMLRSNLIQHMKMKNLKTILFTSSDMQEGKSTTVSNIAVSMAQLGKKTVLVGANMRRPTDYKIFGLSREPGLSDILMGNKSWKEAVNTSVDILIGGVNVDDLLQMPGIDNLSIITTGRPVDNVSELLNSKALDQLLNELKSHFDVVIIDCSPVMAVPDAVTMSDRVDGVALVYKVGSTSKEVLKMAKSHLLQARANLLGVILNDIKTETQVGYSAFSYRYYAEKPEKSKGVIDKWRERFKANQTDDKSKDA
ncbi:MAG: AAA family ATPase [Candidatus Omnitrophica bacterium]|nr:AAA family ATPase [Candidatus Omnitrophota bacterium]